MTDRAIDDSDRDVVAKTQRDAILVPALSPGLHGTVWSTATALE